MNCCSGSHGNNHANQNDTGNGNSRSGSRLPIIIGVILLAGVIYYFAR